MAASANTLDMSTLCWVGVYRNGTLHLEVKEGHTATAHETILATMEGFLHTDPEQLLEEHCHLLFSDSSALTAGHIKDKLEWISEMDSALGAACHMWHVDQVTRYEHGIDMEAILVCNWSTSQS